MTTRRDISPRCDSSPKRPVRHRTRPEPPNLVKDPTRLALGLLSLSLAPLAAYMGLDARMDFYWLGGGVYDVPLWVLMLGCAAVWVVVGVRGWPE